MAEKSGVVECFDGPAVPVAVVVERPVSYELQRRVKGVTCPYSRPDESDVGQVPIDPSELQLSLEVVVNDTPLSVVHVVDQNPSRVWNDYIVARKRMAAFPAASKPSVRRNWDLVGHDLLNVADVADSETVMSFDALSSSTVATDLFFK